MVPKRLQVPFIGEYYYDELVIEAKLKGRTEVAEAASLLCSKLLQRTDQRNRMIQTLADKRGISLEEMRKLLLSKDYQPIEQYEIVQTEEEMEE